MSAQPFQGNTRSRVTFNECEGLQITIPAVCDPLEVVLPGAFGVAIGLATLVLWCSSRGMGFMGTLGLAVSISPGFLLALGGMSLFCLIVAASLVLALRTREIIEIDGQTIAMRTEGYFYYFTRGSAQAFSLSHVRNLRYAPDRRRSRGGGPYGFSVAFDCKGSAGRFGFNLSEVESRRLIKTIKARYPIPDDAVKSLPVENLDGNGAPLRDERNTRRRSFSPSIRSRVASDEIQGFVITIPSIELPTWIVVCTGAVCVPFVSLFLFGIIAGATGPIFGSTCLAFSLLGHNRTVSPHRRPPRLPRARRRRGHSARGRHTDTHKEERCMEKERDFELAGIRNLRWLPGTDQRIAFDSQGKTHRFGRDLTENEGRRLIKTINDRHKFADDDESLPVETQ